MIRSEPSTVKCATNTNITCRERGDEEGILYSLKMAFARPDSVIVHVHLLLSFHGFPRSHMPAASRIVVLVILSYVDINSVALLVVTIN